MNVFHARQGHRLGFLRWNLRQAESWLTWNYRPAQLGSSPGSAYKIDACTLDFAMDPVTQDTMYELNTFAKATHPFISRQQEPRIH